MAKKQPNPINPPAEAPEPEPDADFDPTLPAPTPRAAAPVGFHEFPKMIYRRKNGVTEQKIVASAEEQQRVMKAKGWQESPAFPDDE